MVETFDDDKVYKDRYEETVPKQVKDPVDYYLSQDIKPQVYKYCVVFNPKLNGIEMATSPILFEEGDNYQVSMAI